MYVGICVSIEDFIMLFIKLLIHFSKHLLSVLNARSVVFMEQYETCANPAVEQP